MKRQPGFNHILVYLLTPLFILSTGCTGSPLPATIQVALETQTHTPTVAPSATPEPTPTVELTSTPVPTATPEPTPVDLSQLITEVRQELNLTVPDEFLEIEESEFNVGPNGSYQFMAYAITGYHNGYAFALGGRLEALLGYDRSGSLLMLVRTSSEIGERLNYYSNIEVDYGPDTMRDHWDEYILLGDSLVVVAVTPDTPLSTRDPREEPTPVPRGTVFQHLNEFTVGLPLNCSSWITESAFSEIVASLAVFYSQGQSGNIIRNSEGEPLVVYLESDFGIRLPRRVWPLTSDAQRIVGSFAQIRLLTLLRRLVSSSGPKAA